MTQLEHLDFVEDIGGKSGTVNSHAKQPNSFLYRFVPRHVGTLTQGKLQVLQVTSLRTGTPIAFHPGQADADIFSTRPRSPHLRRGLQDDVGNHPRHGCGRKLAVRRQRIGQGQARDPLQTPRKRPV